MAGSIFSPILKSGWVRNKIRKKGTQFVRKKLWRIMKAAEKKIGIKLPMRAIDSAVKNLATKHEKQINNFIKTKIQSGLGKKRIHKKKQKKR